jgi:hypothetical protein
MSYFVIKINEDAIKQKKNMVEDKANKQTNKKRIFQSHSFFISVSLDAGRL